MASYASVADLTLYAVPSSALAGIPVASQQAALDAQSVFADSKLRARYSLPLQSWDVDLRRCVAILAAYDLLVVRGFNPDAAGDSNLRMRYEDALKWLDDVERQAAHPNVVPSADQSPKYDAPKVTTSPLRGW
jgi:phage gp36-like protein